MVAAANMFEIADREHGIYNHINGFRFTLTSLLVRSREAHVSDIRDKIFGILGLYLQVSSLEQLPPLLEPDYKKTAASVLTNASGQAILDSGNLDGFLYLFHRPEPWSEDVVLPSWVPNWHRGFESDWDPWDLPFILYNANDDVPLDLGGVSVVDGSDVILLRGYRVATVLLTTEIINIEILLSATQILDSIRTLQYWLSTRTVLSMPEKQTNTPTRDMIAMTLIGGENFANRGQPADDHNVLAFLNFLEFVRRNAELPPFGDHNHTIEERPSPEYDAGGYLATMRRNCHRRRVCLTTAGCLGLGPPTMQKNDIVAVLFGSHVPLVLRPRGDHFEVVGICYVFGIMNGEAVREAQANGEVPMLFRIR